MSPRVGGRRTAAGGGSIARPPIYRECYADIATLADSNPVDVPGCAATLLVVQLPVRVSYGGVINNTTAAAGAQLLLVEDGTVIYTVSTRSINANDPGDVFKALTRFPTPGNHVWKVQVQRAFNAGVGHALGTTTSPVILEVEELVA